MPEAENVPTPMSRTAWIHVSRLDEDVIGEALRDLLDKDEWVRWVTESEVPEDVEVRVSF